MQARENHEVDDEMLSLGSSLMGELESLSDQEFDTDIDAELLGSLSPGKRSDDVVTSLPFSKPRVSVVPIALYVAAYFVVGISITLYNKWFISSYGFTYPVSMVLSHTFAVGVVSNFLSRTFFRENLLGDPYWFTRITRSQFWRELVPIGVLLGVDITCTTAAFRYSSIALVEIVKSGSCVCVLVAGIITKQESISLANVLVVLMLSLGILLATLGEVELDLRGLILGVAATVAGASRGIMIQLILSHSERPRIDPLLSLCYLAPIGFVSLLPAWFVLELPRIVGDTTFWDTHQKSNTALLLCGGMFLAFLLNIVELMIIKTTSALTMSVTGITKMFMLIFINAYVFGYEFDVTNVSGIVITFIGICSYNYIRYSRLPARGAYEDEVEMY